MQLGRGAGEAPEDYSAEGRREKQNGPSMCSSSFFNLLFERFTFLEFRLRDLQHFLETVHYFLLNSGWGHRGVSSLQSQHSNSLHLKQTNKQTKTAPNIQAFKSRLAASLARIIICTLLQPHIIQSLCSKQQSRFLASQRSLFAVLIAALGRSVLCYPTFFPGPGDAISSNLQAISHQFSWGANRL